MRTMVESCTTICVNKLQTSIHKEIKKNYVDPSPEEVFNLMKESFEAFEVSGQRFSYEAIPNRFGGHRWFFLCPKCSVKASKLFLPPETSSLEHKYLCKACHGLKNRSAVMYNNRLYKKVFRPMKRLQEIEAKVEKGRLSTQQIQTLLDEYDILSNQLKTCPEYRLYRFKKSRGITL